MVEVVEALVQSEVVDKHHVQVEVVMVVMEKHILYQVDQVTMLVEALVVHLIHKILVVVKVVVVTQQLKDKETQVVEVVEDINLTMEEQVEKVL